MTVENLQHRRAQAEGTFVASPPHHSARSTEQGTTVQHREGTQPFLAYTFAVSKWSPRRPGLVEGILCSWKKDAWLLRVRRPTSLTVASAGMFEAQWFPLRLAANVKIHPVMTRSLF